MATFSIDVDKLILPHKGQQILASGAPLDEADSAMIMIHGRGATAHSILELANEFDVSNVTFIAPQAFQNTWYPYRFIAPIEDNEPGISSGLNLIDTLINELKERGFTEDKIFLLGFSQGACLALEYAARNPKNYGGVIALSGALIGPKGLSRMYEGTFPQTDVFIGCADFDFHIPIENVNESAEIFNDMGAKVEKRIYEGLGHSVNKDEIDFVNSLLLK
jgi:predicted esterase